MPKGSVSVEVFKARLRLARSSSKVNGSGCTLVYATRSPTAKQPKSKLGRWRTAPLRYDVDMTSGNFDRSLASYKPQAQSEAISVVEMFDRFTQQKQRTISIGPLAKYLSLRSKSFSRSIAILVARFQSLGMSLNFNRKHFCF